MTMPLLRVALDVDGVLADVMLAWLEYTNPGRLAPLSKHDMDNWDFWRRHGIKRRDFYAQLDSCWDEWRSVPPTENDLSRATAVLSRLADTVDIVTARSQATNSHVRAWLDHHNITYDKYVQVAAGRMKADLEYDVFIDDSPINAEAFVAKEKRVVLYDQPWNAGVKTDSRPLTSPGAITRVWDLGQAADTIGMMFGRSPRH